MGTKELAGSDPRLAAAVEMVGRTGAEAVQFRYHDDEEPVVWIAVAQYGEDHPMAGAWDAGAGINPIQAIQRLLDQLLDGGKCTHCLRPTGFSFDFDESLPAGELICWYQYDPELRTIRRGCAGSTEKVGAES